MFIVRTVSHNSENRNSSCIISPMGEINKFVLLYSEDNKVLVLVGILLLHSIDNISIVAASCNHPFHGGNCMAVQHAHEAASHTTSLGQRFDVLPQIHMIISKNL